MKNEARSMKQETRKTILMAVVIFATVIAVARLVDVYERLRAKRPQISVTIPEGATVYDIDRILSNASVLQRGAFVSAAGATSSPTREGRLFPDTYYFFASSTAGEVVRKFANDFNAKAAPLLAADAENAERDLVIASIIQKEVASPADQAIIAGVIGRRLKAGMHLNLDATVCYLKQQQNPFANSACALAPADFRIKSPYNTYVYSGLPPAPISNPGTSAIAAAIHPASSSYWYYLSDPKTGRTIYAETLAEQNSNRAKYLK